MMFPLGILPILAILFLFLSFWLTIQVIRQSKSNSHWISLILNGMFLIILLGIFVYGISVNDFTFFAPWIYWILIAAGILVGIVSFIKKDVPGQIMSSGLLLFMAFITLFSIGIILIVLSIIQTIIAIANWKRHGLRIAM
ncbi:hypothetical protein [Lentibacillus cibarius]|uniref:DUF4064 domain-containing protein n=1 Tax=Lentibacillus cibarius TaxID=2583219 RepID=A0A5S3QLA1_9BACI|nr:hypothetical protein [Lentibacillus cibarius]TMN22645.1 hypothetical protein FFL34_11470 [Lentibacillus cibarius]